MYSTVKKYLKASDTLTSSLHKSTDDEEPKPKQQHQRTSTPADDKAYKKRVRSLLGGLRDEDPEKVTKHLLAMEKKKPGGCFIHDHTFHKFSNARSSRICANKSVVRIA